MSLSKLEKARENFKKLEKAREKDVTIKARES